MKLSSSKAGHWAMMLLLVLVPIYFFLVLKPTKMVEKISAMLFGAVTTGEFEVPRKVRQRSFQTDPFGARSYIVAGGGVQQNNPAMTQGDQFGGNFQNIAVTDGAVNNILQNTNPQDPFGIANMTRPGQNQQTQQQKTTDKPATPDQLGVNNNVLDKILQEGHWIGLEAVPLTANIAMANGIPVDIKGVLIDEVTLLSAAVGFLAGDVITNINGKQVTGLKSFQDATKGVANSKTATVAVYRVGQRKKIKVVSKDVLGMAQMEAAPMILATDMAPHGYYGPCDKCHTIAKTTKNTAHLKKDAGDILVTTPPPITWGATAPHRDRGICTNCHKITI